MEIVAVLVGLDDNGSAAEDLAAVTSVPCLTVILKEVDIGIAACGLCRIARL